MSDDLRSALAASLADELLHNYSRGRATAAIDALPGVDAGAVADALADAVRARGHAVVRATLADADAVERFRGSELGAFRTDTALPPDAVLVVDGTGLHAPGIADVWSMSIWASDGDDSEPAEEDARRYLVEVDPPRQADVILDVGDPERPVRRFADWCAVPRRR